MEIYDKTYREEEEALKNVLEDDNLGTWHTDSENELLTEKINEYADECLQMFFKWLSNMWDGGNQRAVKGVCLKSLKK